MNIPISLQWYVNDIVKVASVNAATIKAFASRSIGPSEKRLINTLYTPRLRNRVLQEADPYDPYYVKSASVVERQKVDTGAIRRAKESQVEDGESVSLRRAIERSQNYINPDPQHSVMGGTYAGGNTAENFRGVIRAQEKKERDSLKDRFGKHNSMSMTKFYS